MKRRVSYPASRLLTSALCVVACVAFLAGGGGKGVDAAPQFTAGGELLLPEDYREWVFLTSGLGMTYGPARDDRDADSLFDNVFVTRAAHDAFKRTGEWPEGSMFILEVRKSEANVSINNGGRTQGAVRLIEASVKDSKRFPGTGWGFFSFDGPRGVLNQAAPLPSSASCYACHQNHGAVDSTFVQFYPTLFEVAKARGTIREEYDHKNKK